MKPLKIPTEFIREKNLIIIPQKEYDEYLYLKKILTFKATSAQKKSLQKARRQKEQSYLFYEFKKRVLGNKGS